MLAEPTANCTGARGLIDKSLLDSHFSAEELSNWLFVICGPVPMMDQVEAVLRENGVSEDRLLMERFNYD